MAYMMAAIPIGKQNSDVSMATVRYISYERKKMAVIAIPIYIHYFHKFQKNVPIPLWHT